MTLKTFKNLELILIHLRQWTPSKNQWNELQLDTPKNYLNYAELNMRTYKLFEFMEFICTISRIIWIYAE